MNDNRNNSDINKFEGSKGRGDNITRIKLKKEVGISKYLIRDRGDLPPKAVQHIVTSKTNKRNSSTKDFQGKNKNLVTNTDIPKKVKTNEAVKSKNLEKPSHTVSVKEILDIVIKSDKPTVSDDKGKAVLKQLKDKFNSNTHKHKNVTSRSLVTTDSRSAVIEDSHKISNESNNFDVLIVEDAFNSTKNKGKTNNKIKQVTETITNQETISVDTVPKNKIVSNVTKKSTISPLDNLIDKFKAKDGDVHINTKQNDVPTKSFQRNVVKRNVVESVGHVKGLLDIEEKKRIREKYTFKLKTVEAKVDNNNLKDSQVEVNNDVPKIHNNVANISKKSTEIIKSDINKYLDSKGASRKQPIVRTFTAENDATKVFKAVTFGEKKMSRKTPLQIKIPDIIKNANDDILNNTINDVMKLNISRSREDNAKNMKNAKSIQKNNDKLRGNLKPSKVLQANNDSLARNIKDSKVSQVMNGNLRNNNDLTISRNSNDKLRGNLKPPKALQVNNDSLARNIKDSKVSQVMNGNLRNNNDVKISRNDHNYIDSTVSRAINQLEKLNINTKLPTEIRNSKKCNISKHVNGDNSEKDKSISDIYNDENLSIVPIEKLIRNAKDAKVSCLMNSFKSTNRRDANVSLIDEYLATNTKISKDNLTRHAKESDLKITNVIDNSCNIKEPYISQMIIDKRVEMIPQNQIENLIQVLEENFKSISENEPNMLQNNEKFAKYTNGTSIRGTKISNGVMARSEKRKQFTKKVNNLARNVKNTKSSKSNSEESRSSVKSKISKKGWRPGFRQKQSLTSLVKANGSPPTEVAKWAPSCINNLTQPYYEAWVSTTLAAISNNTKKDNQSLIKYLKRMIEERAQSPDLVYQKYKDERYIGKIKVTHK